MIWFELVVMLLVKVLPLVNFKKLDVGGGWISPGLHVKTIISCRSTTNAIFILSVRPRRSFCSTAV